MIDIGDDRARGRLQRGGGTATERQKPSHAEALLDLGSVLRAGGRLDEARGAFDAALDLYERKGDLVSAERARSELAS